MSTYKPLAPATDETLIHFGKYQGKKLNDVPAGYLDWWLGIENTVKTIQLYKYIVANFDRIQKEMEDKE